jgi:putative membrane protein (TIGR04086 family)
MFGNDGKGIGRSILSNGAAGLFPGLVITLILLFAVSAFISAGKLPVTYADAYVLAAVFLGAAAAGSTAAKRQGEGVLIAGVSAGVGIFLIILFVSAFIPSGKVFSALTCKLAVSALLGGLLGGVLLSRPKRKKKPYRRK